jgi:pSer/pThr/pTyr-binding forkhead associated (FHA) protein
MLISTPTSTTTHTLVLHGGPDDGRCITLDGVTRLGRSPVADVPLEGQTVSRRHALVVLRDGEAVLLDDRSLNGTWCNGERVDEAVLHDGDLIVVGGAALRYRSLPTVAE